MLTGRRSPPPRRIGTASAKPIQNFEAAQIAAALTHGSDSQEHNGDVDRATSRPRGFTKYDQAFTNATG